MQPEKRIYSCRFIPSRSSPRACLQLRTELWALQERRETKPVEVSTSSILSASSTPSAKHGKTTAVYTAMLHSSLLGLSMEEEAQRRINTFHSEKGGGGEFSPELLDRKSLKVEKTRRRIPKKPFKVLDAPALEDDFYLNVVDWSAQNVLAVGLGARVYLWNASTSKVVRLHDFTGSSSVSCVNWNVTGNQLAIGTAGGEVQIWDVARTVLLRTLKSHEQRVGALAWCGVSHQNIIASGSRDRIIRVNDIRTSGGVVSVLDGHKQEVCGLKWSPDDTQLASGGNDNALMLWRMGSPLPQCRFEQHSAAVKALAWSPHQFGILASGGGTADRCIRFWNTSTHTALNHIDTGSQICNIAWSKNVNELVSTHGYSQNQVIVWKYPSMAKQATLVGHTLRVLYLAVSPDGETIVTGAGDETLRFWNIFPPAPNKTSSKEGNVLYQQSHSSIR